MTALVTELGLAAGDTAFLFQLTSPTAEAESNAWYNQRFTIETCFGDFKSSDLHLDRTRLILDVAGACYLIILLGSSRF